MRYRKSRARRRGRTRFARKRKVRGLRIGYRM